MQKIISRKTIYKTIVLALFTSFIIFYLFKTLVDVHDFIEVFRKAKLAPLLLSVALGFSVPILSTIRWQSILRLAGHKITFKQSFVVIMSVWPLSILPGRVGDFARSYPLRTQIKPVITMSAVLLEKVIDVALLLLLSACGFFYLGSYGYAIILFLFAVIIIPTFSTSRFLLRLLPRSLVSRLSPLFTYLELKKLKNRFFLVASITSLINWWVSILMVWFIFKAFGASVSLVSVSAYLPLAIFIGLIPISIGGLGTRDSALIAFFINKATPAQTLATGLGYFFIGYLLFVIIGIPFFIKKFFGSSHSN